MSVSRTTFYGEEYLPSNYKFEIEKTVKQIKKRGSKRIALQFPEGIMHLSTVISDIIRGNTDVESVVVLSDVVYGACCLDDISAYLIDCDLLVHYGHSCLFEIPKSLIGILYVFVEIDIDTEHCVSLAKKHINCESLSVLGTIQYNGAIRKIRKSLESQSLRITDGSLTGKDSVIEIPRVMPLSRGEVLGCTSPKISSENILFLAEGRFHLESAMIQNPDKVFFRYCPSSKKLLHEKHDYKLFREIRKSKQEEAKHSKEYLVIFGTLGRQGSLLILKRVINSLQQRNLSFTVVYLSEIDEEFMQKVPQSTCIIEIACPRIAIDWGVTFPQPMLTPFEYFTMHKSTDEYPMDYYSKEGESLPWRMTI
ncbi:2-(3-amino-3-carboxypropyl)histidine synthase [Nematocida sp. LUAm3]|nr:2-(3-amino-3-carboxypropyl)histidine synthase [Nematocida sp. LUAm3]KAI5173720.1 2-(3-amino-3-carboxypropyl)histidine synthase [Nematocida sp. LUAm2]KAI5176942.1 2-(3-amino-3-carboxypropyl)histidine synthase [Nematocida sp. LUAm1]